MKIKSVSAKNFKRFTNLIIKDIPETTKLVLVVGPNGSGKSSLFDCFYSWYKRHVGFGIDNDMSYFQKETSTITNPHNSITVELYNNQQITKQSMYFRSAYRNDPDFHVNSFTRIGNPEDQIRFSKLIDNDQSVSGNYQRLIHNTMAKLYDPRYDSKTILDVRLELIGKIKKSMQNVFEDLTLNNIGDPLSDGTFKFEKGTSKSFLYKNLSGGEKSAFDLLLDLTIKIDYYQNTVFFIDEPETHMHTSLQTSLVRELFSILPQNSQLWFNTHSLGVIQEAKEIEFKYPGSISIIDFADRDFDTEISITPSVLDKILWEKFLSITLGNFSSLIAPKTIYICEGDYNGVRRKDFDAAIYTQIFSKTNPQVVFISGGSCTDIIKEDHSIFVVLKTLLPGSIILRLIDRDDYSSAEITEFQKRGIRVLALRNLESYLFDDEILQKLVNQYNPSLWQQIKQIKKEKIAASLSRKNAPDDLKSPSGEIYVELKRQLNLTKCGNTVESFMRDTLSLLVTNDTKVYNQLQQDIFS